MHVMRHGEVHNPEKVLYGRLPGYNLSDRASITIDGANVLGAKQRNYAFDTATLPLSNLFLDRRFGLQFRYRL